jgi:hypothetical protein
MDWSTRVWWPDDGSPVGGPTRVLDDGNLSHGGRLGGEDMRACMHLGALGASMPIKGPCPGWQFDD